MIVYAVYVVIALLFFSIGFVLSETIRQLFDHQQYMKALDDYWEMSRKYMSLWEYLIDGSRANRNFVIEENRDGSFLSYTLRVVEDK